MIVNFILGYAEFSDIQTELADLNLDGEINIQDIIVLANLITGN